MKKKKKIMAKGSIVINREMTTQLGKVTAEPGTQLVSVFLGAFTEGDDPAPDARMESLGWRQMAMFECSIRVVMGNDQRDWRLAFSCLGAIDAVEAAIRFANKMVGDEFNRAEPNTPAPYLASITVGTIKLGPIGADGAPFNGRGPSFFGWKHDHDISLEDHLEALRVQAQRHAL